MKAHGPKLYKDKSDIIEERDFRFVPKDADVNFDPAHNRSVIEETIKKNELREKALKKEYMEQVEERVDAGIYLLKEMARKKFNPDTDSARDLALKYFARKELARLRGEEIKLELMARISGNHS